MNFQFKAVLAQYRLLFAIATGALMPLAFAPFDVWPLVILCPACLFLLWNDVRPKHAAALGFWFGMGMFGAGTYWLYNSIYTIGQAPIWLTVFLMIGMAALMASYLAIFGYVQARCMPGNGVMRYLIGLPALWLLCEWWRGWFISGFPWMSSGYSQIDTPLAGLAPIAGVYGVSYVCALMAGAIALLIIGNKLQRVIAVIVCVLPWVCAWPLWNHAWTTPHNSPVSVAVVQGAVPQSEKWSQEWRDKILEHYKELAEPYFGQRLVVLPEAALPDLSYELTDYLSALWNQAHAMNTDIIMGLLHYDSTKDEIFNGVLLLGNDVEWYHKRHLVPFAEYFPVPAAVRNWLRLMSLPYNDLTSGDRLQAPLNAAGEKIAASVCYEDGFGAEQLAVLGQATLLVNVTNDAWFGDTIAAPQHLEISRMRALEAGRDMIRAANDGISALIGSDGKVRATLPRFQAMVLTGNVQPRNGLTPYARVGNWPVLVLSTVLTVLAWLSRRGFKFKRTP